LVLRPALVVGLDPGFARNAPVRAKAAAGGGAVAEAP
jgi:hypothetical protein